ncbi:MAG: cytochrome P450 [Chloroflexota bacterium]|nr:cytochrome P450 [Chloroflexota bacterium]
MNAVAQILEKAVKPLAMKSLLAWERLESGVAYNPLSAQLRAHPYPLYEELRRKDPVHRMRLIDSWVLTNYEDIDLVLRDHRRFGNEGRDFGYIPYISMLDLDPPVHTRIRSLASQGFTPRSVAALEPQIRRRVDELLDALEGRDRIDLIREFAFPLPVMVIAELLGVPPGDREQFNEWSNVVALTVDPLLNEAQVRQVRQAIEELFDYFDGVAAARRKNPQDDLVSVLANAEEDGERLSREDLLINLVLFLTAGNETTRNLIGNGMLALLRHPEQLQRLRDNPGLLETATDELLRYDSPVQLDSRIAREPLEIGGKKIKPGQRVLCILGAANRDPAAFPDPDTLDIGRAAGNHLAFGRGIHYCLGAPLARMEGRIAFEAMLSRYRSLSLAEEPRYRNQVTLRGLETLWLQVKQA